MRLRIAGYDVAQQSFVGFAEYVAQENVDLTRTTFTIQTFDAVFDLPIFQSTDFISKTGINKATAMGILLKLKEHGILKELRPGKGRQSQILGFERFLTIVEGR